MAEEEGIKNPHFDVSAAVIRQLGAELITDEVTAIMELIKNSYDADSDWVKISITTSKTSNPNHFYKDVNGSIVIEDNGFGMSETDIQRGWLIVSVSQKRLDKETGKTTPGGRTPLGDKGVGRLSVQRLGNKFEMVTGKKRKEYFSRVAFDWSDFRDDLPLSKVKLHVSTVPKTYNKEGTTLIISDLIDTQKWQGRSWASFRGHLSQLIFPYKEKRVFEIYLSKDGEPIDLDTLNENLRNLAVSEHTFNFDGSILKIHSRISFDRLSGNTSDDEFIEENIKGDKGYDFFKYLSDGVSNKKYAITDAKYIGKREILFEVTRSYELNSISELIYVDKNGNAVDESDPSIERQFAQPGQFNGEIRDYYLKETEGVSNTFDSLAEFKELVKNQAGIRIFRDGFGLRPYGLDGNDWLKLGESQTKGASFYSLRPGNVIGFISIGAKSNATLKEKTDREGFVISPYSLNFFLLTEKIRDEVNRTIEYTRRSFNNYKSVKASQKHGFKGIKDSFKRLEGTSISAATLVVKTKTLEKEILDATSTLNHEYTRIQPLKTVDKKLYEGSKNFLDHINDLLKNSTKLLTQIETLLQEAKSLDGHVEYLEPLISDLENQLSDFSQLAGLGLTAEALSHELSNIVDRITQQTDKAVKDYNRDSKNAGQILLLLVENIKSAIKSFRKQLSHLAPSLKYVRENKSIHSVNDFVTEIADFYQERFGDNIEIKFKPSSTDFKIEANKGRLNQVVDNILLNSEYWLKERIKIEKGFKPVITIEVKEPFLLIRDNGFGIDTLIEDRIFQPFVTSKPKNIGRGLGLYIVQQLLEATGCSITLSSKRNENNRRYIFQIDFTRILKS